MSIESSPKKTKAKPATKKKMGPASKDPIGELQKVQPIDEDNAIYIRSLFIATLKMLYSRNQEKYHRVPKLISSLEEIRPDLIQLAFIQVPNLLRELIVSQYSSSTPPSTRVIMSTLLLNSQEEETYTVIFFPEPKNTQVSKSLMSIFFNTLSKLKTLNFKVTEIIIVTKVNLSNTSMEQLSLLRQESRFVQLFLDKEVLGPSITSAYSPKIRLLDESETKEFFIKNPRYNKNTMPAISQNDAQIKYIGGKAGNVVEILRSEFIPNNLRANCLSYSRIAN